MNRTGWAAPSRSLSIVLVVLAWALTPPPARGQCTAVEIAMMQGSTRAGADQFGVSMDMDADTIVVGSWLNTNANGTAAGAIYIYERNSGGIDNWGEVAALIASDGGGIDDAYGWAVAISGDTVVVGAYRNDEVKFNAGKVYVYERNQGGPGIWGESKIIMAADGARDDQFGFDVDISGDTIIVGSHRDDNTGADDGSVYLFGRDEGGLATWGQITKIFASDGAANDLFGHSVSLDGDTALVGAFLDDNGKGTDAGSAYVYERDLGGADNWGESAICTASDGSSDDLFGFAVSIDGDRGLVGAYQHDGAANNGGKAFIYGRDEGGAGTWGELAELVGSRVGPGDSFGYAVAMNGDFAVVGAYLDRGVAFESGITYVFGSLYGGVDNFGQSHLLIPSDSELGDRFGYSVAGAGTEAGGGAIFADPAGTNSGAAYAFDLAGPPVNYCTAGTSAAGCQALLSGSGTPSASAASGFSLDATGADGQKSGLFFFGQNGRQNNNWGSGTSFQCVVPPVIRTPLQIGSGTAGVCDGTFTVDLNATWCSTCPLPNKNPGAGALVQAQLWYRDPFNTSNQTTSLSNALEFSVCP